MRCQKCGAELPSGAQFCKHCGTRAEAVPTEAYAALARETAAAAEALGENSLRLAEAYRDGMAARTEELRCVREQSARESAALREQLKAAPASTLFCPGCGAPVEPGSVFCGECGARL